MSTLDFIIIMAVLIVPCATIAAIELSAFLETKKAYRERLNRISDEFND